jgi:DNA-binding NarL/FixJ family response regulator
VETSSFRILVVDDYLPWRFSVSCTLQQDQSLRIVDVASDGLEAIQKAVKLKPDLVLLGVALRKLNGLEAARQIRKAVPGVKLLFATQIIDADMMAEALRDGAHGFISKMDAQGELLPAIGAIRRGEIFIGSGMKG